MSRPLVPLMASVMLLLGAALAQTQPNPVTVVRTTDAIVITGTGPMRYVSNPLTHELLLPDTVLAPNAVIPEGLTSTPHNGSVGLSLPEGTQVALSPDGHSLILTPPKQGPLTPIAPDARAPIYYLLANADPATVAGLLSSLYPNVRTVIDSRQRGLIVLANPEDRQLIQTLLSQMDSPRPQVQFEAQIIEVNQDLTQSLGLQYDSIFTFKLTEGTTPSLLKLGDLTRSPLSLTVGLNVLMTSGAAHVLAQPRITTIDGLEARINSTQTTPVITSLSGGGTTVQTITTGITLRLLPKVAPDGTVETNLTISVSVPTGTTSQGVPQFSTREASTTVRVGNGEPIAIGGLLEDRRVTGTQKVPLLGDIPVLGKLFTTTRTDTHHTDLVIVVTPRLVQSPNESGSGLSSTEGAPASAPSTKSTP